MKGELCLRKSLELDKVRQKNFFPKPLPFPEFREVFCLLGVFFLVGFWFWCVSAEMLY